MGDIDREVGMCVEACVCACVCVFHIAGILFLFSRSTWLSAKNKPSSKRAAVAKGNKNECSTNMPYVLVHHHCSFMESFSKHAQGLAWFNVGR